MGSTLDGIEPGQTLNDRVVDTLVGVRACGAEAGDGAEDDSRVDRLEDIVTQAPYAPWLPDESFAPRHQHQGPFFLTMLMPASVLRSMAMPFLPLLLDTKIGGQAIVVADCMAHDIAAEGFNLDYLGALVAQPHGAQGAGTILQRDPGS